MVASIPLDLHSGILEKTTLPKKLAEHILTNCVHISGSGLLYIEQIGWGARGRALICAGNRYSKWVWKQRVFNVNYGGAWAEIDFGLNLYNPKFYLSPSTDMLCVRSKNNLLLAKINDNLKGNFVRNFATVQLPDVKSGYIALSDSAAYYINNGTVAAYSPGGELIASNEYNFWPLISAFCSKSNLVWYVRNKLDSGLNLVVADCDNWDNVIGEYVISALPRAMTLDTEGDSVACLFDDAIEIYSIESDKLISNMSIPLKRKYDLISFSPDGRSLMVARKDDSEYHGSIVTFRVRPFVVDHVKQSYCLEDAFLALAYLNAQADEAKRACRRSDFFCKNILNVPEELKKALGMQGLVYTGRLNKEEW